MKGREKLESYLPDELLLSLGLSQTYLEERSEADCEIFTPPL